MVARRSSAKRAVVDAIATGARLGGRRLNEVAKRRIVSAFLDYPLWRLPGHYYSPLPDIEVGRAAALKAAAGEVRPADIALNEPAQLELLDRLPPLIRDLAFPAQPEAGWRFYHENSQFPYGDAILLHLLLRHWHPRRIVEVGSGFSTALMTDTVERFLDPPPQITCIEPYPDRLRQLVGELPSFVTLFESPVQHIGLELFDELAAGDVLFIDSTHVVKTGSDVVFELFEVLPRLASGVRVHFHDICWPFEYPPGWVSEGRGWNEVYAVRAFLAGNPHWEITLFNHMMLSLHREWFAEHLPGCLVARQGAGDDVTGHGLWVTKREVGAGLIDAS